MVGHFDGTVTLPRIADVYEALGRFLRDLNLLVEVCMLFVTQSVTLMRPICGRVLPRVIDRKYSCNKKALLAVSGGGGEARGGRGTLLWGGERLPYPAWGTPLPWTDSHL